MKTLGKWLFLIGLLVAILATLFGFAATWLSVVLAIIGIFVGIFYFETDDLTNFAIRYLALGAVYNVFMGFLDPIGGWLTDIFGAAYFFLGPILMTVLVMFFIKKYFGSEM